MLDSGLYLVIFLPSGVLPKRCDLTLARRKTPTTGDQFRLAKGAYVPYFC